MTFFNIAAAVCIMYCLVTTLSYLYTHGFPDNDNWELFWFSVVLGCSSYSVLYAIFTFWSA